MWWLLPTVLAGEVYFGVPVEGVEGFGRVMFQSTRTGWHVQVEEGIIRVYVAPDEEMAHAWIGHIHERLGRLNPQPFVPETIQPTDPTDPTTAVLQFDEAYGDADGLLLFRDGNLGILVHTTEKAMYWALQTQAAAVTEPSPPPAPPTLRQDEMGWWHLEAPDAVHITYVGGTRIDGGGLSFHEPPRAGVAWGPLGRATRIAFDDAGNPLPPDPDTITPPVRQSDQPLPAQTPETPPQ